MNNHHEKWIATVIWGVLLVALIYTSVFAWQTTASDTILNLNAPVWQNILNDTDDEIRVIDWLNLLFNGFIGVLVVLNWLRFSDISLDMFQAYAKGESPFSRLLIYPLRYTLDNKDDELDIEEAESTSISGLLRNLGFIWLTIIIMPPASTLLTRLLN